MHGIIFKQFKEFAREEFGEGIWDDLRESAGVDRTIYMSTRSYPDEELLALLSAAAEEAHTDEQSLLESFGGFLAPALVNMYRAQMEDDWDALDVVEHTEEAIHEVVRMREPDAEPPALETERVDEDTVRIDYSSDRQLCGLGKGLAVAMGEQFGPELAVSESQCMLHGAAHCELVVTPEG